MRRGRILVVDDEESVRFGLSGFLSTHGFEVIEADTCAGAETAYRDGDLDVVLLDYRLPDGTALDLLPRLRTGDDPVPTVILTAHGSIDLAVRAIQDGAEHFLTKPVELKALLVILERLLEKSRQRRRHLAGPARAARAPLDPFLGSSAAIRELADQARRVVAAESPVLILGETGTGKGVLASWIHRSGPRASEPFVDINCAGLGGELLDTELFGHEKGAFTGASGVKQGLLEIAHRGSLFLDEIGDMDVGVQAKLLKVVEEKSFRRLGGVRTHSVDIRLLTATRLDPLLLVREGRFREDLYYRVSTVALRMPALRERVADIGPLAGRILGDLAADLGKPGLRLSSKSLARLEGHAWPGNVRELRNVLERAALLFDAPVLDPRSLQFGPEPGFAGEPGDGDLTLAALERRHIERVLHQEGGHVERAARRLGIPRSTLYQKIKALGIA